MADAIVPCKAIARPAALSAISLLAVILLLVVGRWGTVDTSLPLYLGDLGLRPCYCPDTILQPSPRNLRCAPSTCINTTASCTETSPTSPHQLTRFSPPTQNSTHASSPLPRARDITLIRKPGKRSRQPSENSELVSFVSVFASFPRSLLLNLAPQERTACRS